MFYLQFLDSILKSLFLFPFLFNIRDEFIMLCFNFAFLRLQKSFLSEQVLEKIIMLNL